MQDGTYVINLDEYKSIGTNWIALYVSASNITYFDNFGVYMFQKKLKNL